MRLPARIAASTTIALFVAGLAGSGVASATPATSATSAAVIATHGLGAGAPIGHASSEIAAVKAASVAMTSVPASVDLRKWAVTPGYQGSLNSCVPWVVDYAMLGWYSNYSGRAGQPFAPMYTYSQISVAGDNGSDIATVLKMAVAQGNASRADYPQGDYNWKTKPTAAERADAAHYKIAGYETLFTTAGYAANAEVLKRALASNHPVAIELSVRHGFDYIGTSPTSVDTDVTSDIRGDHEVLAVGYDAAGLIVQNSWGTGWGDGGFGRISWRVVQTDVGEAETIDGFVPVPALPSVSAPAVAYHATALHTDAATSDKITWTGKAGTTGPITRYYVWTQTDGGPFVIAKLPSPIATSLTLSTHAGHKYRVAVRPSAGTKLGTLRYSAVFTA